MLPEIYLSPTSKLCDQESYNSRLPIYPNLPTGLVFDGTTGTIGGTPTLASGATDYTVTAINAAGSNSKVINLTVTLPPAPHIAYTTPHNHPLNTAITPLSPTNTGGAVPAIAYGKSTTVAGGSTAADVNGTGTAASFYYPAGIIFDSGGNLLIAENNSNLIRKMTSAGVISTLTGTAGTGYVNGTFLTARFNQPYATAVDAMGNIFFNRCG